MSGGLTATRLRSILLVVIILIIAAITGGFLFVRNNLQNYAVEIGQLNADAQSGDKNIDTLRTLETTLVKEQSAIANAHSIVADSSTYADAMVTDITRIAAESGVTITSIEFAATDSTSAVALPPTTGASPAQPAAGPSGVTKKAVSVALQSPLKYANLMNFIRKVETNKLKMQIATVSMTKDKDDTVSTQTFSIEVYVRS